MNRKKLLAIVGVASSALWASERRLQLRLQSDYSKPASPVTAA